MEKPVPAEVEIHPLLKRRWSPRAFADKKVSKNILRRIFEAARWAPSSGNEQPWSFFVGIKGDGETWQKIFDVLDNGNQRWCKDAPVLVLAVAAEKIARNGKSNKHYGHDVGQAMSHFTFQAMSENIFVHQMAGFYPEKAKEIFSIPDGFEPFTTAALGYIGEPQQLPEDLEKRENEPRSRKLPEEIIFTETWDKAYSF